MPNPDRETGAVTVGGALRRLGRAGVTVARRPCGSHRSGAERRPVPAGGGPAIRMPGGRCPAPGMPQAGAAWAGESLTAAGAD